MAIYSWTAAGKTLSSTPTEWAQQQAQVSAFTIANDATNGQYLFVDCNDGADSFLQFLDAGDTHEDVEILIKTDAVLEVYARGGFNPSSNRIGMKHSGSTLSSWQVTSNSGSSGGSQSDSLTITDLRYHLFQVVGDTWRYKQWSASGSEPADWEHEFAGNVTHTGAGTVGVMAYNGDVKVYEFEVRTGADMTAVTVPDTTAPTFVVGQEPAVTATTGSGHTITAQLDEPGTLYAIRMADGATGPTDGAQCKAWHDAGPSGDVLEVQSVAVPAANTDASVTFTGGTFSMPYDYYLVAADDEATPNVQATATLVEDTTSAPVLAIASADDVTADGQTFTFTLQDSQAAPTEARINGTDLGTLTDQGNRVYSYTAPLLVDDPTATLAVDVDSTTLTTTIDYANSYIYILTDHGAPDANAVLTDAQFGTTQPVELKVITDFDAAVLVVDWQAMSDNQEWLTDIETASSVTRVSDNFSSATLGYYVQETGATGTLDVTVGTAVVSIDSIVAGSNVATVNFSYPGTDVTGFEYRLDGGTWTATGNPVQLSGLTADQSYTIEIAPVNDSGRGVATSETFATSSTVDTTPAPFSFTAQTGRQLDVDAISNAITVTGVDAGQDIPISVSGDTGSAYRVATNGVDYGGWTSAPTTVRLNYKVQVKHRTSPEYSSGGGDGVRATTLNIGTTTDTFTSTTIADTDAPTITLTGGNVNHIQGTAWTDPGYSATDNSGEAITVAPEVPDINALGPQTINYTATDSSGNTATAQRIVTVIEAPVTLPPAPTISLVGGNRTLSVGDTWSDPGYSATDGEGNPIPPDQITVTPSTVDTSTAKTVTLTYSVTGPYGQTSTAERIVTVVADLDITAFAPDARTCICSRDLLSGASEKLFFKQPAEVLDYDFDMTDWLATQSDTLAASGHSVEIIGDGLLASAHGIVDGSSRYKVWLEDGAVGNSYPVRLTALTVSGRTAVFQFRLVALQRY